MRSHGWYDLPPFSYDKERVVLTISAWSSPLAPARPLASREAASDLGRELHEARGYPSRTPRRERGSSTAIVFSVDEQSLVAESETSGEEELKRILRRVFSLDLDLSEFAASVAGEPGLARALARGGGRMLRAPSVFEDAVKVLLTTNCTWAATRLMVTRLIDLHGTGAFPQAEDVARLSRSRLREKVRCGYRAEALARFARRVASGKLDLSLWEEPRVPAEHTRKAILFEHGFGPYAAEGLLRILGRHDFLAIDSWIRQQYRRLHPGPKKATDSSIARRYARYGSFKGLALWLDMTRHWHEDRESSGRKDAVPESPKSKAKSPKRT